ncbi:MAG: hypothetical protein ACFFEJ_14485 [Candidatus Thorarchaeota archaeon]
MIRRKSGMLAGIVVLIVLSCSIPVSTQSSYAFVIDSLYDSDELLPYPDLSGPLNYLEVGSSNEFSFSIEEDTDLSNIAVLNWTHFAGTYLEYDTTPSLPVCQEFVYFSQYFSWNHEVIPTALNVSLFYQVEASGNFLQDNWPGMFEVQVWLIMEDGTRRVANRFYWGHTGYQHHFSLIDLSSIDMVFTPLVNSEETQAQLAIALVPSWRFLDDFGQQPWQYYNGSVIARFREVHLDALYRESKEKPNVRAPIFNNTWKLGDSDRFQDSELDSNQDLYILTVQDYNGAPWGTTLTKVNRQSQILWQKSWNGTEAIFWRGLSVSSSRIYLIAEVEASPGSDILVESYTLQGVFVEQITLDIMTFDFAAEIAVGPDDSIYLGTYTSVQMERNFLVKLDSALIPQWTENFGSYQYDTIRSLQVDSQGNAYTRTDHTITKFGQNGSFEWEIDAFDKEMFVCQDGSSIITSSTGWATNITMVSENGDSIWSFKSQFRYTPTWRELFYASWFAEGPDSLLYALYTTYGYHTSTIIVVFNMEGEQLENYTVAFSNIAYSGIDVPRFRRIHITEDNSIYVVGRIMDDDWNYEVTVSVFGAEPLILGIPSTTFISTTIGLSVVTIVIVFLQYRKGQS